MTKKFKTILVSVSAVLALAVMLSVIFFVVTPNKSQNVKDYNWPTLLPTDTAAGSPISTLPTEGEWFVLSKERNPSLPFSINCEIEGDRITALLPAGTHINLLFPEWDLGGTVKVDKKELVSGSDGFDFRTPQEILVYKNGDIKKYTIYIMTLDTGLPSISINTEDGSAIDSKSEYVKCDVFAGGGTADEYSFSKNKTVSATGKIKGRGWTSWYYYPKKSFTLKFDEEQKFPGLPAHKEWVLAANFADRSLIRNAVAAKLARDVNMETVMDVNFVDLWVNGIYEGSYQLIEKIEADSHRVDIKEFDEKKDPEDIGFIIETTGHNKEEGEFGTWTNGQDADRPSLWQKLNDNITLDPISGDMFFTSLHYDGIIYNVKYPSDGKLLDLPAASRNTYLEYIYNYMDEMEAAIKSRDFKAASEYLDMESMARWYIVEELSMNTDSRLHCSCYMYKDAGGKMKMGPVWDFDLGLGNGKYANETNANGTYLDGSRWFSDLVSMPEFREEVKRIWDKSYKDITALPAFVDETASVLTHSANLNFSLWSITESAEHTYWRSTTSIPTYQEQIGYLKAFIEKRIDYMQNKISNW